MLSRIAESLFWIGRYVERVDGTARLVDVVRLAMLEGGLGASDDSAHMVLNAVMGERTQQRVSYAELRDRLVFDASNPSSVTGSWNAARENARRARETLSTDLWEGINTAWLRWGRLGAPDGTARHLSWARERSILIAGIADSTMSHDEAWDFLVLGRYLERADMTARILNAGTLPIGGLSWQSVLSSCGGTQGFMRSSQGVFTDEAVATFLVLNRQFPRSVMYAIIQAEAALERLDPERTPVGFTVEGRRLLGRIRTSLEYRQPDHVIRELGPQMARVQRMVTEVAVSVGERYFPGGPEQSWTEEIK
ncbi:MAG: alpha-E domain-containing protein [Propioniciclava sp.]|uniref:alpha-E domain-containing protein n=1 Tax=Propioniciclava sp. TaxID=2038686 RepID=UPI0039E71126